MRRISIQTISLITFVEICILRERSSDNIKGCSISNVCKQCSVYILYAVLHEKIKLNSLNKENTYGGDYFFAFHFVCFRARDKFQQRVLFYTAGNFISHWFHSKCKLNGVFERLLASTYRRIFNVSRMNLITSSFISVNFPVYFSFAIQTRISRQ